MLDYTFLIIMFLLLLISAIASLRFPWFGLIVGIISIFVLKDTLVNPTVIMGYVSNNNIVTTVTQNFPEFQIIGIVLIVMDIGCVIMGAVNNYD